MGCDLCGKEGQLYDTKIEGTVMTVCESCKGHGEVVRRIPTASEQKHAAKRQGHEESHPARASTSGTNEEAMLLVREDYAKPLKEAREKMGLKQEDLAKRLRIKESQLHKYESGGKKPDLETARMLERALNVSLIEQHIEKHGGDASVTKSGPLTIADMIKKKS